MARDEEWETIKKMFCELGGIAVNVVARDCEKGKGMFALEKHGVVHVGVPWRLAIPEEYICIKNGKPTIKKDECDVKVERYLDFWENYLNYVVHSSGGIMASERFEVELKEMPNDLKRELAEASVVNIDKRHSGEWGEIIAKSYLRSRHVNNNGKLFIAPVWELVNHSSTHPRFKIGTDGINTKYELAGGMEVMHQYNKSSPLKRLFDYGFANNDPMSYSFSMCLDVITSGKKRVQIKIRGMRLLKNKFEWEEDGSSYIIDGLPVGNKFNISQPLYYWIELLGRMEITTDSKGAFLEIINFNLNSRKQMAKLAQTRKNSQLLTDLVKCLDMECETIEATKRAAMQ